MYLRNKYGDGYFIKLAHDKPLPVEDVSSTLGIENDQNACEMERWECLLYWKENAFCVGK